MDDLKSYGKLFIQYWRPFLVLVILGGISGFLYASLQTTKFVASATLFVGKIPEASTDSYYTFEGFYSQQAAADYTDVVIGLLKSKELAVEAAMDAKLDTSGESIESFVEAKKTAPQVINLKVALENREDSKKLLLALTKLVDKRSKDLAKQGTKNLFVESASNQTSVYAVNPPTILYTLGSSVIGGFIGILAAAFINYIKTPRG